jgi:hypothetical protein
VAKQLNNEPQTDPRDAAARDNLKSGNRPRQLQKRQSSEKNFLAHGFDFIEQFRFAFREEINNPRVH